MQPLISIVIPTYGRPEKLWNCLQAIGGQRYPANRFEVIVIDDGSPVDVAPGVASFGKAYPLRVIRQQNCGPAVARNKGMQLAAGSLVAFTDDDCRPDPDWLGRLADSHKRHPEAGLGGRIRNAMPDRICSEASQLLVDYLYEYFGTSSKGIAFFTSNNLAFPSEALKDLGGFDESFTLAAGEDREICDRWRRLGKPLLYVPEAVVNHAHDLSIVRFAKQQFTYGRGAWHFHKVRERYTKTAHRIEPVQFYAGMMRYPFGKLSWPRSLQASFLMALSQAANAAGFFQEKFAGRNR